MLTLELGAAEVDEAGCAELLLLGTEDDKLSVVVVVGVTMTTTDEVVGVTTSVGVLVVGAVVSVTWVAVYVMHEHAELTAAISPAQF